MMANSSTSYEFIAAVRVFHVYRQEWQPQENVELICSHESDNFFDAFAINTRNDEGKTTGHLPRKIFRPTKFLLDRGVKISATVVDTKYRRSPLFQGGFGIPCLVKVMMPANTVLEHRLINRYKEMVGRLYKEPDNPVIVGSFVESNFQPSAKKTTVQKKKSLASQKRLDVRTIFAKSRERSETQERSIHEDIEVVERLE